MKRIAPVLLIAVMLFCIAAAPGCNVDIDWKNVAKEAVAEWVGSAVITAIDKYSGDDIKELSIGWVMEQAGDVAFLKPYLDYVNLEPIVEAAWDTIWDNIRRVARDNGMDTDADGPRDPYAWHVDPGDFPGLIDDLANMIE